MKDWTVRIRTHFFCRSLAPSADRMSSYTVFPLHVGIILWYFLRIAPNITKHVSNKDAQLYGFYVVPGISMFFAFLSFIKSAYTDPGIVPKSKKPLEHVPEKFIVVNGEECTLKYCKTCEMYRPPRTVHCGVCNNCVSGKLL